MGHLTNVQIKMYTWLVLCPILVNNVGSTEIGYMWDSRYGSTLVDMFSAIFRLVDHSLFDSYSAELLKRNNCATAEKLFQLIAL
jgi:hypothetical protein